MLPAPTRPLAGQSELWQNAVSGARGNKISGSTPRLSQNPGYFFKKTIAPRLFVELPAKLAGRPVVVLSNNDGNVIARNPLAKALGIGMGQPYFEIRQTVTELTQGS